MYFDYFMVKFAHAPSRDIVPRSALLVLNVESNHVNSKQDQETRLSPTKPMR